MLIPRSFTIDDKIYPKFKKECKDRSISISSWLRNKMIKQLKEWKK